MDTERIPFVVEEMLLDDVPAVVAIEERVFAVPWPAYAFEYELKYNHRGRFLVVRLQEPLASSQESVPLLGYGGLWLMGDEAHLCTLAVHPNWRRRGLGELLLTHLIGHATADNADMLTLEVRASNTAAQQLYEKYGFRALGLRKRYYSDNHEDAIRMSTQPLSSPAFRERLTLLQVLLQSRLVQGKRSVDTVD
ncbi:MAG TPA: ribosomal protein S18-alanine N-acetyltransferase [Anaerolineae bacterium]|nr:ribosomal protein S18-alanine N-acetyltransferase [Anaerolineae bacterium]